MAARLTAPGTHFCSRISGADCLCSLLCLALPRPAAPDEVRRVLCRCQQWSHVFWGKFTLAHPMSGVGTLASEPLSWGRPHLGSRLPTQGHCDSP